MNLETCELTPKGAGAVSVIAVRGPEARTRVRALAPRARLDAGVVEFVRLSADGEDLDEALVLCLGPELVELHVHASPPLVRRVLAFFGGPGRGASGAARGETLEARLAVASCEAAARILLDQLEGALERELEATARLDDDAAFRERLRVLLARGRAARCLWRPRRVVLAGGVNAGKSTLFNVLVGRERVIVDPTAGTTRDLIREPALLGAWPVELVDTAGERELECTSGPESVEREGQVLARSVRERADLVLWLRPGDAPGPDESAPTAPTVTGSAVVTIFTRGDLVDPDRIPRLSTHGAPLVSALREPGAAREIVATAFREAFGLEPDPWQPGAGVPHEESQLEALEAALDLEPSAARELVAGLALRPAPG